MEPGFRVSEGGAKPTLKSGAPDPVFRVPRIKAEEAYTPPAIPTRRTMSKVYAGIGLFNWSALTAPLLPNLTKALPGLIKAAIKSHKANGFRILFSVRTNPDLFALRAILMIWSDKLSGSIYLSRVFGSSVPPALVRWERPPECGDGREKKQTYVIAKQSDLQHDDRARQGRRDERRSANSSILFGRLRHQ
jgi:hypothetical protein